MRAVPEALGSGGAEVVSFPVLASGWDDLIARLEAAPTDCQWGFHIWKSWPKEVALAGGRAFAFEAITPVLRDLAGCYLDVVRAAIRLPGEIQARPVGPRLPRP